MTTQDRAPNFRSKNGKLFLVRCFACDHELGRENYGPAVASGECAWCGWKEENSMKKQKTKEFKVWVLVRDGEPMSDDWGGGQFEVYNSRAMARECLFSPDECVRPARLIVDLAGKG